MKPGFNKTVILVETDLQVKLNLKGLKKAFQGTVGPMVIKK
jgi:hypothetical protein